MIGWLLIKLRLGSSRAFCLFIWWKKWMNKSHKVHRHRIMDNGCWIILELNETEKIHQNQNWTLFWVQQLHISKMWRGKTTVNIVMLEREEERNPSKHIQHSTTTAGRCGPNFVFIKIIFSELNWIELTKEKFNKPNLLNCGSCVCTSSSSTYRYNVSFLYWWHATLLLIMLMMVIGKNSICCRVLFFSSSSL